MVKHCKCGHTMEFRLRTVIYRNKVDIENVPIYSCDRCSRSELYPQVKHVLTSLIAELGTEPERQHFLFNDTCELSRVMLLSEERAGVPLSELVQERINELLDTLLLAQSLEDKLWIDDTRKRLSQIAAFSKLAKLPL